MTRLKKILILTAFPPSNYGAGLNYTLNLVKDLQKSYTIDIIYFDFPGIEMTIPFFKRISNTFILKLFRTFFFPFLHPYYTCRFSWLLLFRIVKIKDNYDYIYFDFNTVHIYSLFIKHKAKILMLHDVVIQKYKRRKGLFNCVQSFWIYYSEKVILNYSHGSFFVFSKKDQNILLKVFKKNSKIVDFYIGEKVLQTKPDKIISQFCFMGTWNRIENYESLLFFIHTVLPYIKAEDKFIIIGGGMPQSFSKETNDPRLDYIGFVDNPYGLISHSKALIAPLFHGAGVKVKTLEALMCGIPVIGTRVAFEGIDPGMLKYSKCCVTSRDFVMAINNFDSKYYNRIEWKEFIITMYPKRKLIDYL